MRFTENAITKVESAYPHNRKKHTKKDFGTFGLSLFANGHIITNGHELCAVEELDLLIKELQAMQETIKEELGIF